MRDEPSNQMRASATEGPESLTRSTTQRQALHNTDC